MTYFSNRKACLLTKHQKEEVILPVLSQSGLIIQTESGFDTDQLGTFSGEIKRRGSQLDAARAKAKMAIELSACPIGIASEGSFGPHPDIFIAPADFELVLLIDSENDLEIAAWEISTDTNFACTEVSDYSSALEFADRVHFPSHCLLVKYIDKNGITQIADKGIWSHQELRSAIEYAVLHSIDKTAKIETDMRAVYNPLRMAVIRKATENLFKKMNSLCPVCITPGFDVTDVIKGLPCEICKLPGNYVLNHIYTCRKCHFIKKVDRPDGLQYSPALYCNFCNP